MPVFVWTIANGSLHIWISTCHDILTRDSFTDTATEDVQGTRTPVVNTTLVPKETPLDEWPVEAKLIIATARPGSMLDWTKWKK